MAYSLTSSRYSHFLRGVAPRLLLALLLTGPGVARAQDAQDSPERIVWQKVPIHLELTVGKERRVDFPGPVEVGVPPRLAAAVRVQSIAGTVYLLAHRAFDPTRVMVRETASERMYLLDIGATAEGGSGQPVVVHAAEAPADPNAPAATVDASAPITPHYGYVTLTRFAAQQLYAPARLLADLPGVVRVPVAHEAVDLVRGAAVSAEPLVAWRAGCRGSVPHRGQDHQPHPPPRDPGPT